MTQDTQRRNATIFLLVILVALVYLSFLLVKPYLDVILLALVTAVLLKPLYSFFLGRKWLRGRPTVAITLTLVAFILIIAIPLVLLANLTISQIGEMFDSLSGLADASLEGILEGVESFIKTFVSDFTLDKEAFIEALRSAARWAASALASLAVDLGTSLPGLIIAIILFFALLASLLPAYDSLIHLAEDLSPLEVDLSDLYIRKATAMISSMVKGVFIIAIIQGAAMGVFFWLAGVPYAWFLMILCMAFATLPVVGISFIVIPVSIILFLTGNVWQGVLVLVGFYGCVNWIDVLLRPKLISKEAYLNFSLVLLGIFGGLAWAGLLGLIYGPVIMILLTTTVRIYVENFSHRALRAQVPDEDAGGAPDP